MNADYAQFAARDEAARTKYQADMADMPPLQQGEWSWWVGPNEEYLTNSADSRDEAVRIGRDEMDGFCIMEARQGELDLAKAFGIEHFCESVDDVFEECQHEDFEGFMTGYSQQSLDLLETLVRQVIRRWQVQMRDEDGEACVPAVFTDIRNEESFSAEGGAA